MAQEHVERRLAAIFAADVVGYSRLVAMDEDELHHLVNQICDACGIKTDKIISYVATNNYDAGVMAARRMGKILGGKGKIGVIGFMPGSASTMDREAGFNDTIAKEYPLIKNLGVRFPMAVASCS